MKKSSYRNEFLLAKRAYVSLRLTPPPSFFHQGGQKHLRAKHSVNEQFSVSAEAAWKLADEHPGVMGEGVRIAVIEYNWNRHHVDLEDATIDVDGNGPLVVDGKPELNREHRNHGTAVLGLLVAQHRQDEGMRGIVPRAQIQLYAPLIVDGERRVDLAIDAALANLSRGDILLVEQQACAEFVSDECVTTLPIEYEPRAYEAIKRATIQGKITVIEPAGNSSLNLGTDWLEKRPPDDSGAILVGASEGQSFARLGSSNFGPRVDLHSWGQGVDTLGYDDVVSPEENRLYSFSFGKTSAAAAIVAGVAASVQGYARGRGRILTPGQMLGLLRGTGTGDIGLGIGPHPNLNAALSRLVRDEWPPD